MRSKISSIISIILAMIVTSCNLSFDLEPAQDSAYIGGAITADMNGNGTMDDGELPLDNVIVSLSGCGEARTALTGADGSFNFSGLPTGVCILEVAKGGWSYSASYPTPGYPIPVTTDKSQPAALAIFMRPSDLAGPTPVPAEPTATLASTDIPLTVTPTATFTPTVPMVAAIDKGVNCRFGPSTYYAAIDALLVGSPVPIIGRIEDSSWWQINSPSGGSGKCFVSASVTKTSGNLTGIPVVPAPDVSVTDVQLSINVIQNQFCKQAIVDVRAKITVNGPTEVSYHYAVTTPSTSNEVAFTMVQYQEAGEYPIEFQELATECGDHSLTLVVTDPNQKSARADFTVNGAP